MATRSCARAACSRLIVMPTTRAWWRWAACIAREPQPHPTSRSRRPGASWRPELAADELVLVGLGLGQAHGGRREPGARVRHGRAEHDVVELVAHVVVVAHHLAVAAEGVASAAGPHLLGRRRERGADDAGEPSRLPARGSVRAMKRTPRPSTWSRARSTARRSPSTSEVAGHVGAPDAERVGRPEDPSHGPWSDAQRAHGVDGTQRAAVPRLDADRWGIPRDRHGQRAEDVGDGPGVRFGQDLDVAVRRPVRSPALTGRVLVGEVAVRRSQPAAASGEAHAADLPARCVTGRLTPTEVTTCGRTRSLDRPVNRVRAPWI